MLRYDRVSVRFGSTLALDDVSLEVAPGRTTVILGPSGGGKSTLLRLAAGLQQPTEGRVLFDGEMLCALTLTSARHRTGYVIQEGGLFPHLDVHANVTLLAAHLRWPAARVQRRFRELLEVVQLDPAVAHRHPDELSGGQRQRVGLMRALMLDPPLLLLDEPLGALDPLVRRELQRDLRALFRRRDRTVVMVTHDVAEAVMLGEHAVVLRDGRIVHDGTPVELVMHPADAFVREFVSAQRGARELLADGDA